MEMQRQQMDMMMKMVTQATGCKVENPIPTFTPFEPATEMWKDYWSRFKTFVETHSISTEKEAKVFLSNQSPVVYKLISNLASQEAPSRDVNSLTLAEINVYMEEQYHHTHFVVRERYKFWTALKRQPGETIHDLAARIRQSAVTCDFPSIKNPLDEAMRTKFMCSVENDSIIQALFKSKEEELTFNKAIQVATEIEDVRQATRETMTPHEQEVHKLKNDNGRRVAKRGDKFYKKKEEVTFQKKRFSSQTRQKKKQGAQRPCQRCNGHHRADTCRFKTAECRYCHKSGHIERACYKKRRDEEEGILMIKEAQEKSTVNSLSSNTLKTQLTISRKDISFEVDTGAADSFMSHKTWTRIGKPQLSPCDIKYQCASNSPLPVMGTITVEVKRDSVPYQMQFVVTKLNLHLLGRKAIAKLQISVDEMLGMTKVNKVFENLKPDIALQKACKQVCEEFPNIFKDELGKLKDFELDIKFKEEARPVFHKPRTVPYAIQEELDRALETGIKKGIWKPVSFSDYGTPIVPIKKKAMNGQKPKLRVCGDYSVTVNPQLETHRYPIPLPDDLMRKLGGGHGFTKIDLADAYNQICLSPASQERLALSTSKGVLLQTRLPFGISSAPGYFQQIMDQLTQDLPGVAVYLDDILVSGKDAQDHVKNLRSLLQRLDEKGLRCNKAKCCFAQPTVEYLGHLLSREGIAKGPKVDAVVKMPAPTDVSSLKAFLGQVQFYSKFLPNLSTTLEPLNHLTQKNVKWEWNSKQHAAFLKVKELLCSDVVLAHYDPSLEIGISCDASNCGIGAVLFHKYPDKTERPIANASKTLSPAQKKYSQIQKEALAIVFALNKFHQFLFGRKFLLVTDHKPLVNIFSPDKAIPAMAANRLARWSLTLSQYQYQIVYRKSAEHGNADALSRLPQGPDKSFDQKETWEDTDTVCTIKTIGSQLNKKNADVVTEESRKDQVISAVISNCKNGWRRQRKRNDPMYSEIEKYRKCQDSLSHEGGCLFYGPRLVIPASLREKVLDILHTGHTGMQRMKQLARTAVYWPGIDSEIATLCKKCTGCAEHQNSPPKEVNHPWIRPEKPWMRIHIDHAINFLGSNWLIVVDAYSKYPCIHKTSSTSTATTIDLLEESFAHFGYPNQIVSDNATSFTSKEFQVWCNERGIEHLTGAPYHAATNGAAERMVQTFKQAMKKSSKPPRAALREFLMQYRRTPLPCGNSPSYLLLGRDIRTQIDTFKPTREVRPQKPQVPTKRQFSEGDSVYTLNFSRRRERDPKWLPGTVKQVLGPRSYLIALQPSGHVGKRHIDQLRKRIAETKTNEGKDNSESSTHEDSPM